MPIITKIEQKVKKEKRLEVKHGRTGPVEVKAERDEKKLLIKMLNSKVVRRREKSHLLH